MEDLSTSFEDSIKEIKNISEKVNKKKEELQKNVQGVFTKLRKEINEREDKLLTDIENIFNKLYFNDEIIIISEKLPKRIKYSLDKGKGINKEWKDEELN